MLTDFENSFTIGNSNKLEERSVECGICPIPQQTNCSFNYDWMHCAMRMHKTAIFPLPLLKLTSQLCSSAPISYKTQKFRPFGH